MVAEHGSKRMALLYGLHRVLQKLSANRALIMPNLLMALPVDNPALAKVSSDALAVVRRIVPTDPVIGQFPRQSRVVAQRFACGSECHVIWVEGQFAGHLWTARHRYIEDEVRCAYEMADPATGVWVYDVFVEPAFRHGRVLGRLWKAVDEGLAAEGVQWTFCRINRFNVASLKSHKRLGAVTVGQALFLVLGRLQLSLLPGGGASRASLTWRSSPTLTVAAPPGVPHT
ncbi:MAG: N-acetyltransferase [Leptothrix sp. (in: Bacteria)]|nr:N-acetyltransferase [Leptothrix sp. (in: b-proteobacteria)]